MREEWLNILVILILVLSISSCSSTESGHRTKLNLYETCVSASLQLKQDIAHCTALVNESETKWVLKTEGENMNSPKM